MNFVTENPISQTRPAACWRSLGLLGVCLVGATGLAQASTHWSFQPVDRPAIPQVRDDAAVRNTIDAFIFRKLEDVNLRPAGEASREVLVRRLHYTLTGLPPTFEQVQAFAGDARPDAYERRVERLLNSPRFGERWGRHWLDVARYADTKGYVFQEDRNYPYAYTYRDWVIRALNEDLPYDAFIKKQLAADILPNVQKEDLAALGFLTVGNRFLNRGHLIIDDRIDVVTRGFLGLTVACARCHDHLFDPIPTADYYSLYGVFASSEEPKELPVIGGVPDSPQYRAFLAEKKKREDAITKFIDEKLGYLHSEAGVMAYLEVLVAARGKDNEQLGLLADERNLYDKVAFRWRKFVDHRTSADDLIWGPWNRLLQIPEAEFPDQAREVLDNLPPSNHALIRTALKATPPKTHKDVMTLYAKLIAEAFAVRDGRMPKKHALLGLIGNSSFPVNLNRDSLRSHVHRKDRDHIRNLQNKVDSFVSKSKFAPPRAMVVRDRAAPVRQQVFLRGNPNSRGEVVERQCLKILSGDDRKPFNGKGSGRLALAKAIVDEANPLVARVLVNRVWAHHFGTGLVATPSDFGNQGEPPSHPALLDYLATDFIESGWSVKRLHRLIVTSATYRRASAVPEPLPDNDPDNRLLSRMNRRRMDFEAMRDALIHAGTGMDHRMGGQSADLLKRPFSPRRAVYGKIVRQNIPGVFRTFDVANPSIHSPKRPETTVPQQALFAMNSDFMQEQARAAAAPLRTVDHPVAVRQLYRRILARDPRPQEHQLAIQYLANGKLEQLAQVLLMSNEFLFVD